MTKFLNKKIFFYFLITSFIFTLDRISKIYIINIAKTYGEVDIYLNQFINIILVWNTGIGFGLFSSENKIFYNLLTALIILINCAIFYLSLVETRIKSFFLMIILGGSLGNLFDRIYYNAVPDFIDVNYEGYHWFIFNVADIFITIGIICLILGEFIIYNQKNDKT